MKYPCNLIRDILPLYHDQVCSAESIDAVKEHLGECESCRAYYDKICEADYMETVVYDEEKEKQTADSYKQVKKKNRRFVFWVILAAVGGLFLTDVLFVLFVLGIFAVDGALAKVEVHDNIADYELFRSGDRAEEKYKNKWDMDESIWPEHITADMDVKEYKMVYYDPFDKQYLGYLVVNYGEDAYQKEVARLTAYPSTEYLGYYGVTGFEDYELLAIYADDYQGFVYALTDGDNTIIYAEEIFCNYFMDLDYMKYIPEDYLPEGFDATSNNPYELEKRKELGID